MYEYKQYINDTMIFFVMEKVEGITTVYIYIYNDYVYVLLFTHVVFFNWWKRRWMYLERV